MQFITYFLLLYAVFKHEEKLISSAAPHLLFAVIWTLCSTATTQQYALPLAEHLYSPAIPQNFEIPVAPYAPSVPVKGVEVLPQVYKTPLRENSNPVYLNENTKIDIRDKSGQYSHGFSVGDTKVSEQGSLITTNGGWEYVIAKKGSYSYTSPEGKKISVHYIADHNGFRIVDSSDNI